MLKCFKINLKCFFDPENMKKTPSKVAHNRPPMFFSVLPKTAWSAQAVENPYSFFNVSYT
jgi:hypothetical protein